MLGKEAEAETVVADYQAKVDGASVRLAEVVGDETVMLLAPYDRQLRVYGSQRQFGRVLYQDLGLTPPEGALIPDDVQVVSVEWRCETCRASRARRNWRWCATSASG